MDWKDGLTAAAIVGLGYWGLTKVVKGPIYHAEEFCLACSMVNHDPETHAFCETCRVKCVVCGELLDEDTDGENYENEICGTVSCYEEAGIIPEWMGNSYYAKDYLKEFPAEVLEKYGYSAESYSADECNDCGTMMAISPCCETSYCPAQDFDCDCEKHYDPTGHDYPETDMETGERYGNWEWSDDFWYQPKNAKSFAANPQGRPRCSKCEYRYGMKTCGACGDIQCERCFGSSGWCKSCPPKCAWCNTPAHSCSNCSEPNYLCVNCCGEYNAESFSADDWECKSCGSNYLRFSEHFDKDGRKDESLDGFFCGNCELSPCGIYQTDSEPCTCDISEYGKYTFLGRKPHPRYPSQFEEDARIRILGKKSMAETHAYSYAYNEGHSDSRKTGEYRPSLSTPKQEAAFKRILKQKAEEDEEFPHTKQFLCGLEGHKWKMKPLKKTCKKCGFVIKNRLRGHR